MKRIISCLLLMTTVVGLLSGCGRKNLMEAPAYPLDKATVEAELANQKLDWTVEEVAAEAEGQTMFDMYNAEGKKIAALFSEGKGDSRFLRVSFYSALKESDKDCAVIENKEWIGIIAAATVLYGGFKDQYEPYKSFTKGGKDKDSGKIRTYIREDMLNEEDRVYDEMVKWTHEYDGIYCIYKLGQPENVDRDLNKPKQELISVTYYNDDS